MAAFFAITGMCVTGIGAFVAARAVILTEAQAETLSGTYWNGNKALKRSLLAQSRAASEGLWAIVVGTALQVAGELYPLIVA